MSRELRVIGPRQLELVDDNDPPLQPGEVRAQAIVSGISHGTEMNLYRGTSPFHARRFDRDLRLFVEVPEAERYPIYPMRIGYEWVGRVVEVGAGVTSLRVGDLVHLPRAHRSTHIFPADLRTDYGSIEPLPAGVEPAHAACLALAGVALQAVHDAHIKLGDRVAVFGLGAIGLLTVQLARLNGARWIVAVDPIAARRSLAEALGADRTLDPTAGDVAYAIKSADAHRGVDIAIEVSGHYPALHEAMRSVRMGGTVVAAGYYQGGATPLRMGEEWHHNRITMISSMGVWGCPHRDYPSWDRARVHATVVHLLAAGELHVAEMITHRIPFERAAEAYALVDEHPDAIVKVLLVYE